MRSQERKTHQGDAAEGWLRGQLRGTSEARALPIFPCSHARPQATPGIFTHQSL